MKTTYIKHYPHQRSVSCIATIGNFDGLHCGHKALLNRAKELSEKKGLKFAVITFEPDVRSYFTKEPVKRLTTLKERSRLFQKFGVDELILLNFDKKMADTSADDFITKCLKWLNIDTLICGYDFTFGAFPQKTADDLKESEIPTEVIPAVKYDNTKISSTWIKQLIEKGDITLANRLLGREYFQTGTVQRGHQIGRTIGYKTANVSYEKDKMLLPIGVYAGTLILDEKEYPAMINIGRNPTVFEQHRIVVEAHILDFDEDIYDREVTLRFHAFLRSDYRFASLDELKAQLVRDEKSTREYFRNMIY